MSLKLSSPVTDVPRVGPARAQLLSKLGIRYVRDFLYTFPRRYDDFSRITPIADLTVGQKMTVRGKVRAVNPVWGWQGRRRVLRIFVEIADESGVLAVTWYNLRFLPRQLWPGRELFVAGTVEPPHPRPLLRKGEGVRGDTSPGKGEVGQGSGEVKFSMRSPVLEFIDPNHDHTHTARITPVYPETHGVTSRWLRYQVKTLLPLMRAVPEYLPQQIRTRHSLLGIHEAIDAAHFPPSSERLEEAQRRLRFDELFFLQLAALVRRRARVQQTAWPVPADPTVQSDFVSALPFALTAAQVAAMEDVARDMGRPVPMNRLLQGDVGSGKSVVALAATYSALQAGYSVMYMAPTELLARQQADAFAGILGRDCVQLLIGATPLPDKRKIKERLRGEEALCVVGTHALLQSDVSSQRCALVIVDEQHRFGVAQRAVLAVAATDERAAVVPHFLSMTATPIPRTLNLTVYGDLDVSVLNELPPGRRPVVTAVVGPGERERVYAQVRAQLAAGRQGYVIAPLVAQSPKLEAKSAVEAYAEITGLFPGVAVGLLHGQMKTEEKEGVAAQFAAGALQLLVSTSVVEVGINVPNATVMIIEGAERFGLAQLHQLRGRVGRGQEQSYCYLFPTTEGEADSARLTILKRTTDGFVIAEEDLQQRGPGEVYGVAQSGYGNLQVASLLDYPTIKIARAEAQQLLDEDPELKEYPIIQKKVAQKNLHVHLE